MTIKKPMSVKRPTVKADPMSAGAEGVPEMPAAPAAATIADRFKLDAPDPNAKKAASGIGGTAAAVAGLVALVVAGVLTFILFQHWEFLKGA